MPEPIILALGLVFGSIGLAYFMYGRKRDRMVYVATGAVLMFYPYAFENPWAIGLVGIALLFLPRFFDF